MIRLGVPDARCNGTVNNRTPESIHSLVDAHCTSEGER